MTGTVSNIVTARKYGFISGENGQEYLFHASDIDGEWDELAAGFDNVGGGKIKVLFEPIKTPKGPRAKNVSVVEVDGMRYKRILIHGQLLTNFMITGIIPSIRCIDGLPEGTKFVYAIPSYHRGVLIVVEHESFLNLRDGAEIPEFLSPKFEKF